MDVCGKYELRDVTPSETVGFDRYLYVRKDGERMYSLNLVLPSGLSIPKHLEISSFGVAWPCGVLRVKS